MAVREPVFLGPAFRDGAEVDEPAEANGPKPDPAASSVESSADSYAKSGLSEERRRRYRDRLLKFMDTESPWRDENLRLADVARRASIPAHHLSQVLNQELGVNFFDFVNRYRVEEAKRRLAANGGRASTLEIALECGFASKSSFHRIFKRFVGVTPGELSQRTSGPHLDAKQDF
jgi:AraC-like DNA-binding protein